LVNPDFRDILSAFNAEGVEYLVVGAYALAAHGHPRATGDIDLWINAQPDNAGRVWRALVRFGAPVDDLKRDDLTKPDLIFQIGIAPRRVDVLTGIDGVDFAAAWPDRLTVPLGDLSVPVISREFLIRNKRACGRPQDLADLAWLERAP
jgi:hypothetical protein